MKRKRTSFTKWLEVMQLDIPMAAHTLQVSRGTIKNYCAGVTSPPYCTRVVMCLLAECDGPVENPWPK